MPKRGIRGTKCAHYRYWVCSLYSKVGGALDIWFRQLHQYHTSEILDKMVEVLKIGLKCKVEKNGGLICNGVSINRRERNRALSKGGFTNP